MQVYPVIKKVNEMYFKTILISFIYTLGWQEVINILEDWKVIFTLLKRKFFFCHNWLSIFLASSISLVT